MNWRAKLDDGRVLGEYRKRPAAVEALKAAGVTVNRAGYLVGGGVEPVYPPVEPRKLDDTIIAGCKGRWEQEQMDAADFTSDAARFFDTGGELV